MQIKALKIMNVLVSKQNSLGKNSLEKNVVSCLLSYVSFSFYVLFLYVIWDINLKKMTQ